MTTETRRKANESVDRDVRYKQIRNILKGGLILTAKQVAVEMNKRGLTPTTERNFAAPRLTELVEKGEVEVVGKTKCNFTHKTVAMYRLKRA